MQVDAASYATAKATQQVKEQVAVSLLKKSLEQTKRMMAELLQKPPQPPKNDQGTISLYA